jgi:hypothetical protein
MIEPGTIVAVVQQTHIHLYGGYNPSPSITPFARLRSPVVASPPLSFRENDGVLLVAHHQAHSYVRLSDP